MPSGSPAFPQPPSGRPVRVLVSAGEASGDLYAAALVGALRRLQPEMEFFGCAGPRMQAAGVEPVVDAASLSVVGIVEVAAHIPRIYREFRRLIRAARERRPTLAILTDSPDFHLRLAPRLRAAGIPVVYLVAPQVWAWRRGRLKTMRRNISRLLCIFPFEEEFFGRNGVRAAYIGHPLTRLARPSCSKAAFLEKHRLDPDRPLIALLPGSRPGEIARHLPIVADAVRHMEGQGGGHFLLALPAGLRNRTGERFFAEPIGGAPIQIIEGETWDAIAHAELALAASGTVTMEAALLGTPMVTFYKVTPLTWWLGRPFVNVPYFSMVNLVAGKRIVPELIQNEMTAENLANSGVSLLRDPAARSRMKQELDGLVQRLATTRDPMENAAAAVMELIEDVSNVQRGC